MPARCISPAATVTVDRCTPSICARNSCVRFSASDSILSAEVNNQRASLASTSCILLHRTDCVTWTICKYVNACTICCSTPPLKNSSRTIELWMRNPSPTPWIRTEWDICGWSKSAGSPANPSRPITPTSTDSPLSVNASVEIKPLFKKYKYSMGRFGSESRIPNGRSTGVRNLANDAYSSSGNCARMTLRDRIVESVKVRLVDNWAFLYARKSSGRKDWLPTRRGAGSCD